MVVGIPARLGTEGSQSVSRLVRSEGIGTGAKSEPAAREAQFHELDAFVRQATSSGLASPIDAGAMAALTAPTMTCSAAAPAPDGSVPDGVVCAQTADLRALVADLRAGRLDGDAEVAAGAEVPSDSARAGAAIEQLGSSNRATSLATLKDAFRKMLENDPEGMKGVVEAYAGKIPGLSIETLSAKLAEIVLTDLVKQGFRDGQVLPIPTATELRARVAALADFQRGRGRDPGALDALNAALAFPAGREGTAIVAAAPTEEEGRRLLEILGRRGAGRSLIGADALLARVDAAGAEPRGFWASLFSKSEATTAADDVVGQMIDAAVTPAQVQLMARLDKQKLEVLERAIATFVRNRCDTAAKNAATIKDLGVKLENIARQANQIIATQLNGQGGQRLEAQGGPTAT